MVTGYAAVLPSGELDAGLESLPLGARSRDGDAVVSTMLAFGELGASLGMLPSRPGAVLGQSTRDRW